MSSYPDFDTVEGETLDLRICATIDAKDSVALLYFCGGDEKACVVQPCSLALSQYQLHIGPLGRETCVQLPYVAISTWGVARASSAVTKAFVQVQQAEEAARVACGVCAGGAVLVHDNGAPTAVPQLSPPGQQVQQQQVQPSAAASTRPRYADPLPSLFVVTLQTKHVWQHRLIVQSERLLKNLKAHLAMAQCLARVTDLPAFAYAEDRWRRQSSNASNVKAATSNGQADAQGAATSEAKASNTGSSSPMWTTEFGWNLYSPHREFTRQLCLDASRTAPAVATEADMQDGRIGLQRDLRSWFNLVDLRDEERGRDTERRSADFFYTSTPTYPDLFLQPKLVDRELLLKAMSARSRARVPAISYVCLRTGAVLARSSQPLMRSPQLGADSDVCYTLINMGYVPHHTQPRYAAATTAAAPVATAASAAVTAATMRSPLATPTPPTGGALATAAAAALTTMGALAGNTVHNKNSSSDNTSYTAASPVTPASAAASASPRPVRPPSLFDDDETDNTAAPPAVTVAPGPSHTNITNSSGTQSRNASTAVAQRGPPLATANAPAGSVGRSDGSAAGTTRLPTATAASAARGSSPDGVVASVDTPHAPSGPASAGLAKILFVADCRPQITAAGNAQLGGGYESGSFYAFCNTNFFEIDNIYGVTKAFEKLRAIVSRYQGNTAEKTFLRRLYDADWLAITQRVLVCAVTAAQSLQSGVSCLVHCTDGWDRTSQCCALAMLMLDPYYRTIVGFCTLIEKEFCSFGHKFAERSGHQLPGRTSFFTHSGVSSSDTETQQQQHGGGGGGATRLDTSPIFLHFLDAVFQIHRQYPTCFEFTTELLAYLSEVVYGCLYGTFLCNGEQERRLEGVRLRTASAWTDVLRQAEREKRGDVPLNFVNIWYDATTAWRFISQRRRGGLAGGGQGEGGQGEGAKTSAAPAASASSPLADFVILPNCSSKRLVFWESLYMREDADRYLSYNPHVRTPQRQQKVSWGADFDAFLAGEVAAACAERAREMPKLMALETFMTHDASNAYAVSGARSAWCVYDSVNCFNCYKTFGMFSTKTQCPVCKQYFCSECQVHDGILH